MAVGVLIGWALLAGCGGGDDGDLAAGETGGNASTIDSGEGITRDEFVERANGICRTAVKDFRRDVRENGLERYLEFVHATLEDEVTQIEALGAPAGDEDQVEGIVREARQTIDLIESKEEGWTIKANEALPRAEERAADYGIGACFISLPRG